MPALTVKPDLDPRGGGGNAWSIKEMKEDTVVLGSLCFPGRRRIRGKIFFFFRAAPAAYGGSQARGRIRATAAGLSQSHSNARSKLHLKPTPQLMAMLDPQPTERGQVLNPQPHGS